MHIVIIADSIDKQSAGIHYYTKNLIIHLLKNDKKNSYTIIKLNQKVIKEGISSISLPNTLKFLKNDPIRNFFTLPGLIKKMKPDIVIEPAHFGPFNLPNHIKRITVIHDLTPVKLPEFHKIGSRLLQKLFFPHLIRNADQLITNSLNTTADLNHYYPKSKQKTTPIYLGKADFFKPSFNEKVLNKYKITQPYFLSVGTIEPRKNLKTLLKAYKIFRRETAQKVKLVICGNVGWKSRSFFQTFFKHPFKEDILLIGYADRLDLPFLYSHAKAFIYPSYYEGFGLPVLEALSCGAPCVISNRSSLPEVGEDAALYFSPESDRELADHLKLLCNDEQLGKELGRKALAQAEKFSWTKFADEFINVLNQFDAKL